jgi:serine/threonine protein phosphatase 1
MLAKLLKSRRSAPIAAPSLPAGERIYAIGDVHGCLAELDRLLAAIVQDEAGRERARTTLIFLGDLVDRGPASAQVVRRVRQLATMRQVRCLAGNHEEILLAAMDGDAAALKLFCRIGGRETALSYGMSASEYEGADYDELAAALRRRVSAEDRAFLTAMEDMIEIGDYLFVHAGVRPDLDLAEQRTADLRWIRTRFLDHDRPLAKMVVHGHTISDEVETRPHRIGVDTGAYLTGTLSALGLEDDRRWTLRS